MDYDIMANKSLIPVTRIEILDNFNEASKIFETQFGQLYTQYLEDCTNQIIRIEFGDFKDYFNAFFRNTPKFIFYLDRAQRSQKLLQEIDGDCVLAQIDIEKALLFPKSLFNLYEEEWKKENKNVGN